MKSILFQTLAASIAMIINVLPTNGENLNTLCQNEKSTIVSSDPGNDPANVTFVINNLDSIYFDISLAVINGNTVEFPISFKSDDIINALDFSFKYNELELEYDTIINLTNYIQHLSYYNANDSTVRFTSYSFTQPYTQDTALVLVRFTVLTGQLCSADLNVVDALLNGDACSEKIIECQLIGINEINENLVSVYPNPASDRVSVSVPVSAEVSLFDIYGKVVKQSVIVEPGSEYVIEISNFENGIYLLNIQNEATSITRKIVIEN